MSASLWLGIGAGILVMGGHAGLRVLTHRLALRASDRRMFLVFELGGLLARMGLVFGAVALGVVFVPVHDWAFVGTVLTLLVFSIGIEVRLILRKMNQGTLGP